MTVSVRPGWSSALVALALAATTAVLIGHWADDASWLTVRGSLAGLLLLGTGLAVGSTGLVGAASLPILAAAVIGIDRPGGHAWGPALLLAVLWYVTTESAWLSIEARTETVRTAAIERQRAREVATVVVVSVSVGLGGMAFASLAPPRTAAVRAAAASVVLVGLAALARHLAGRNPPPDPAGGRG